jgi:hypothetical protein
MKRKGHKQPRAKTEKGGAQEHNLLNTNEYQEEEEQKKNEGIAFLL